MQSRLLLTFSFLFARFDEGWQNLVVMQTLSKGFGLAGIRMGISFQTPEFAQILANTKAPYSIGTPTATLALRALSEENLRATEAKAVHLKKNRTWLLDVLKRDFTKSIGAPSGNNDANFIMVPVFSKAGAPRLDNVRAMAIYKRLAEEKGVVVRFRGNELGCEACLRMTIGTDKECETLVEKLREALEEI
jgi:histidinol-phosphate aminotransferase